jgi:integrative and conjugative element protein (TIGR02256 family)
VFVASDASVAVELESEALEAMLELCRASGKLETGGILIGRYGEYGDRVLVFRITGPPPDSRRFPANFIRGVAGLARRLRAEWKEGHYYVGEWHFHPSNSPEPSPTDRRQIADFAEDASLLCPRPVLMIVGGDPNSQPWLWAGVVRETGLGELPEVSSATAVTH